MMKVMFSMIAYFLCSVVHAQAIPNNINAVQTTTQNAYIYTNNAVMNPNAGVALKPHPVIHSSPVITANDVAITTSVQSLITQNRDLAGSNIRVLCRQGVVTLEGNVDSMAKASEAASVAKSVGGVKNVVSKITVQFDPLKNSPAQTPR